LATGFFANASGADSDNIAVGRNATATGDGTTNMALGSGASATGIHSIAIGTGAVATGSIAAGTNALASNGGAAFGDESEASGLDSSAIGPNSTASHANAAAFGNGATTTRVNQQVFGTASNTYTMTGIASDQSKAVIGAPTHIVASNASGDLAAYTFAELGLVQPTDLSNFATKGDIAGLQSQIDHLGKRDNQLTEGLAAVVALAQPILRSGQTFGVSAGWGGYDDANAIGLSAAGVLADNLLRPGSGTLALYGGIGIGTGEGQVAGRAGLSFGW
jgi:hypothetical protein